MHPRNPWHTVQPRHAGHSADCRHSEGARHSLPRGHGGQPGQFEHSGHSTGAKSRISGRWELLLLLGGCRSGPGGAVSPGDRGCPWSLLVTSTDRCSSPETPFDRPCACPPLALGHRAVCSGQAPLDGTRTAGTVPDREYAHAGTAGGDEGPRRWRCRSVPWQMGRDL